MAAPEYDVVSESGASLPQLFDQPLQIIDFDRESVPPAWLLPPTIGPYGTRASGRKTQSPHQRQRMDRQADTR
jgi:hypothetical protein